jgi:Na+/proline symporter
MVQRYLCTDRPAKAGGALLASGLVVLVQFALFLLIGVLLFAFYRPFEQPGYADAAVGSFPFASPDRVFPDFITKYMPPGLAGLVVAAIFAAALSSSLSAISSTVVNDLYRPFRPARGDAHYLRVSKALVFMFGVVQVGVALALMRSNKSALDQVLAVAGLVNGPVLGLFLVGSLFKRVGERPALAGMFVSVLVMTYVWWFHSRQIAWPWYPLIGSMIVVVVALALSWVLPGPTRREPRAFEVLEPAAHD